jgi:DNA-directed RNA polymerase specialized sigma24 family protein
MSGMTARERGDLAEAMLPVAANLAVLVHGDGGPEDVQEVMAGLTDTQKNALIVVLAGLVDPEQSVGKALGWLDHNEHGALTVPSWSEDRSVRELAPETGEGLDDDFVDPVAVQRFVKGFRVEVHDAEFLEAVQHCAARGMTLADVDRLRGWRKKTAENWVNRLRKRHQRAGRAFPDLGLPKARSFSEEDVIRIRERSFDGASDMELGMSYDVVRETIRAIVTGKRYAEYGGPIRQTRSQESLKASREHMCGHAAGSAADQAGWQAKNALLTPQERDVVCQRTVDGEGVKDLAVEYQVSVKTIRNYAA